MDQDLKSVFLRAAEIVEERDYRRGAPQKKSGPVGIYEALCLASTPEVPEEIILSVAYYSKVSPEQLEKHKEVASALCAYLKLVCPQDFPWEMVWHWENVFARAKDKNAIAKILRSIAETSVLVH